MSDDEHYYLFRCMLCGKLIRLKVKSRSVVTTTSKKRVQKYIVLHGDPFPHIIIVNINEKGFIVKNMFIKHYAESKIFAEIVDDLGLEKLSKILTLALIGEIPCLGSLNENILRLIKFIFEDGTSICSKEIVQSPRNPDKEDIGETPIDYRPMMNRLLESLQLDREFVVSYIKHIVNTYLNYMELIKNFVLSGQYLSAEKLIELLKNDLSLDEIRFLLAILHYKEPKLAKYISMIELKVLDIVR